MLELRKLYLRFVVAYQSLRDGLVKGIEKGKGREWKGNNRIPGMPMLGLGFPPPPGNILFLNFGDN